MNSRRLRSAMDAPKLAMTITMALPRLRSFENNRRSRPSASRPVRSAATIPAMTTGQPKERAPMRVRNAAEHHADGAGQDERDIGAPGEEFAVGEIGEAQDRIRQRDADRPEPDERAHDQAIGEELEVHAAPSSGLAPR